ncbi:MAG: chemotaxis protein CheW [Candidatus Coatesbacteria bacterium]|nr:chemotaxis protein CheW [Candidatus Coatesbacteria bacterium]
MAVIDRHLIFTFAGQRLAIQVGRVREICNFIQLGGNGSKSACVGGAHSLRGIEVPVLDLGAVLGPGFSSGAAPKCLLVVQTGDSSSELTAGIPADEVKAILEVRSDQIRAIRAADALSQSNLLAVKGQHDKAGLVLDADVLIMLANARRRAALGTIARTVQAAAAAWRHLS